MNYNTQRSRLAISEYGRHIQLMIDEAVKIEDREERNKRALYIIGVMAQLNQQMKDSGDFKHKLWDHLFIMSDFKLDVDSPYPKPSPENLNSKPEQLKYPNANMRFRHYGKIVEKLIEKAQDMETGSEKDIVISAIANQLKKSFLTWNRDSVDDDQIIQDLKILSEGKLALSDGVKLASVSDVTNPSSYSQQQGKKFHGKNQKKNKFKRKFGGSNSY